MNDLCLVVNKKGVQRVAKTEFSCILSGWFRCLLKIHPLDDHFVVDILVMEVYLTC